MTALVRSLAFGPRYRTGRSSPRMPGCQLLPAATLPAQAAMPALRDTADDLEMRVSCLPAGLSALAAEIS
jgi:hypothetical protein